MQKQQSSTSIQSPQKVSQTPSSISFNVLGFVPALVVQHFMKTLRQPRSLPESQPLRSVVMFADISGFTNLTEALSKIGNEGAEVMAFAINRYMELLVKGIGRSGGDIFKFAGDAMIVLWPPPEVPSDNPYEEQEQLKILMRQAIQSAMDIQDKLNDTNILEKIKLSVKIGFGIGDINIIYVGGVFNRREYLATGDPLTQAFESEHHAKKGGETIVSRQVFELVNEFFDFEEIQEDDPHHKSENGPFYYVKDFKNKKVRMKADALLIKNNLTPSTFEMIKPQITSYIPAALLPYIEIDQETWSAELRRLSVMFVNLGIDLSDAKTKEGLKQIQKVIETVQKCVYYHQGSVNKLLMDDKGSTLIVVFGLPPLSHQDDPVRAILASHSLIVELGHINCKCSIGIATGTVFAGVVGTSGSRREYSVLGDSVNLAARLMQMACTETTRKIICCEHTAGGAQHKILMRYYKMVKLKGKEKELPVFEPSFISAEEVKQLTKIDFFSDVKTHQNSLVLNDAMFSEPQVMQRLITKFFHMVGRSKETQWLERLSEAFLKNQESVGFAVIKGSYGIGKSLMVRVVLQRLKLDEHKYLKENQLTIVVNSLGPMSKTLKMCGFRQVMQQLFILIAKRRKREPNLELLQELVPQTLEGYELFKEIVGIKPFEWISNFPSTENPIISQEKIEAERKQIILLCRALLRYFVDESAPVRSRRASVTSEMSSNESQNANAGQIYEFYPLVVVLEDLNLYDTLSFMMIRDVLVHFTRVLFIATVRDQYHEGPFLMKKTEEKKSSAPSQDEVFSEGLANIEDVLESKNFHTCEIKALQINELKILIKQQFNLEGFQLERERILLTPPTTDIECVKKKINDQLMFFDNKPWLWQEGVNELFYQYLYLRTGGNPLTVLYMMQNLLRSRLIQISEKNQTIGIIGEPLRYTLDNEETITLEAPQCWVQVNGPVIDKLGCLDSLLMKVASVIGDIFDIQTLQKIQPFKDQIQSERLMKILQDLEASDLLEVLEVSDFNIFYRFTYPFMREVIYQRMTYNQRRSIHRAVAEAIQTMQHPFEQEETRERKKLEFHWTQAEQKWSISQPTTASHVDRFSHKAKRSIIVKQIQQILSKANNEVNAVIRQGQLEKKSDKNITWAARFVVITSKEFKYYYTEQDYLNHNEPLGSVWLKSIFGLVPLNQKEQSNKDWAFQLSASSWIKKRQEMPMRKFFFAANSEDQLEEWSIYLEFAKAKAIYDEFVANFGKISFPLGVNQDNYDQNIRIEIQQKPKKLNFGWGGLQDNKQNQSMSRRASRASKAVIPQTYKFQKEKTQEELFGMTSQSEIQQLKNYLKVFLSKSTLLFYAHLFQMSYQKNDDAYLRFGQQIKISRAHHELFDINPREQDLLRQSKFQVGQLYINRQEGYKVLSDSEENFSEGKRDVLEDVPATSSSNIFMINKDKRRQSSINPSPLAAIKEEDERQDKPPPFKTQYVSKMETQVSENYVSEQAQDTKNRNISAMQTVKLVIPGVKAAVPKQGAETKIDTKRSMESKSDTKRSIETKSDNKSETRKQTSISPFFQPAKLTQHHERKEISSAILLDQDIGQQPTDQSILKPELSPSNFMERNKHSELNLEGTAAKDCFSLKGYQFFLQKGDKVLIKKIYTENEYLKCTYRGMTGILKKSDLSYALPTDIPPELINQLMSQVNSVVKSSKHNATPSKPANLLDEVQRVLAQSRYQY